jgi:tRNA(adenine34) deaminase
MDAGSWDGEVGGVPVPVYNMIGGSELRDKTRLCQNCDLIVPRDRTLASAGDDPGSDHARAALSAGGASPQAETASSAGGASSEGGTAMSAGGASQHGAAAVQPADERFMRLAIEQAELAIAHGDVPVGAVIADERGDVIATGHNERELRQDPSAHAEMIALRSAAEHIGHWRLLGTTLYVTLEPCAMCAGAIVLARVPRVVYGTDDPKAGAAGSVLDILAEPRLNHRPAVTAGVLQPECAALLKDFFAARR